MRATSERVDWRSQMMPLTKEIVDHYSKFLGTDNGNRIDFRRRSKFYNPDLKTYDFSLKTLLAEPRAGEGGK